MSNSQLPDVDQQYRSGISYGNALKVLSDQNPRQRKALLDDVLGSELTLLAPLRHVVCLPAFQKLITDSSYTQLLLNRDALLLDLAAWCNQESLSRIAAFLDGVIQVFWPTHIASFRQAHERGFGNSAEGPDSTTQNIFNKSPVEDFSWEKNSPTSIKAIIADLLTKAQQAVHNGAHEKSIKLLSQVLRLDPSRADVYIKRAQMYISVRDTASAIQDYSEALRLQPRNSEARARRGEAHLLLGNMEGAREDWKQAAWSGHQQAIELITEHTLKTSQNLLTSLRGNEAIILLNEAIQVNPSDANLLITRGIAYQATNQHGQAKADFTSALKINPTIAQAYALRGKSYAIQGKEALAISDLEIAIGFGSAVATTLLADLKLKKSNNDPTSYSKDQEENRELDSKLNDNIKTPRISKKRPHGILSTMTLIVILVFGIAVSKKQGLQDPNEQG